MTYGDYEFTPVPMVTLGKEFIKMGNQEIIGTTFTVNLKGTLVSYASGGGLANMSALQNLMRAEVDRDGDLFLLTCDATDILRCYPRIKSISFDTSNDNWVFTCPYTIELEFDDEFSVDGCAFDFSFDDSYDICAGALETRYSPYLRELSETWDVEFADDKSHYDELLPDASRDANPIFLRLTHNISAGGKAHYASGGLSMPAWEQARNAVISLLDYDSTRISNSGVFNIDVSTYSTYNHMRTNTTDEAGGSFSVNESWLICNTGVGIPAPAIEDFTIDVRNSIENDRNTVGIQGNIQGLEDRTYGNSPSSFQITKTKYESAKEYWAIAKNRLYQRCNHAIQVGAYGGRNLNLNVLNSTVGHQWANGIISYSYEYDNRPSNCVPSALSESITVTDSNPVDIFASIQVIGRGNGPILQDMNTVTAATREVSVEVTMPAGSGCLTDGTVALLATNPRTAVYNNLIAGVYLDLLETYASGNVFKHQDTESWNPKEGRYTRSIGWTMNDCV